MLNHPTGEKKVSRRNTVFPFNPADPEVMRKETIRRLTDDSFCRKDAPDRDREVSLRIQIQKGGEQ